MIYAAMNQLISFIKNEKYRVTITNFLEKLSPDLPEGSFLLAGSKIYVRIMSYNTLQPELCDIEAHDKYIDVQSTLVGAEGISIYPRKHLIEEVSYNEKEDIIFFKKDTMMPIAHTVNLPGYFTLLLPEEAHRPKELAAGCTHVKKFVIKIAVDVFSSMK